jgi:hypothetical protein
MLTPRNAFLEKLKTIFNGDKWAIALQMPARLAQRLFYFAKILSSVRPEPVEGRSFHEERLLITQNYRITVQWDYFWKHFQSRLKPP